MVFIYRNLDLLSHRGPSGLSDQISCNFMSPLHHTSPCLTWPTFRFKLVIYLFIAPTASIGRQFQSLTVTCWLKPLLQLQGKMYLLASLCSFFSCVSLFFWLGSSLPFNILLSFICIWKNKDPAFSFHFLNQAKHLFFFFFFTCRLFGIRITLPSSEQTQRGSAQGMNKPKVTQTS